MHRGEPGYALAPQHVAQAKHPIKAPALRGPVVSEGPGRREEPTETHPFT